MRRDFLPAAVGIGGLVGVAVAVDVWAVRTARPTISRSVALALEHPVLAPLVVGVVSGLVHHLVFDPVVRRLEAAHSAALPRLGT